MDAEYKDMNESAPIPSLTLEPELENTPKLVVAEETKLQQTKVAEPVLTPEEKNLLDAWQNAPQAVRAAALAALQAGAKKEKPTRTIRMGNVKNDGKMAIVNGDINGNVNL